MPKYRVKSGTIRLRKRDKKGKPYGPEIANRVNSIIDISPETATKFKAHLIPLGPDSTFIDEMDEYSEISSREPNMKVVPSKDDSGLYDVINTITKIKVNSKPLPLKEATKLVRGIDIPISFSESDAIKEDKKETTDKKKEKKIDKNDPCPCGSGKKYKKCCGKNKE